MFSSTSFLLSLFGWGSELGCANKDSPKDRVDSGQVEVDSDGDGIGETDDCNDTDANLSAWVDLYYDGDADGYGDQAAVLEKVCEGTSYYVSNNLDCNDANPAINPAATEVCDLLNVDEDCDGTADDGDTSTDTSTKTTWYADTDADNYGDPNTTSLTCEQPPSYVPDSSDCNDAAIAVNPDVSELCNSIDDNCDGIVDQDAIDRNYSYADADSDGYGDPATEILLCEIPTGNVTNAEDCNDTQTTINPAATEVCDLLNVDEDCDGTVDDADTNTYESTKTTWYADADADNYGDPNTTSFTCEQPTSYVSDSSDCNDTTNSAFPGATEMCDGIDNNCDTITDEPDAADAATWYADTDADGFGWWESFLQACYQLSGYVSDSSDCDDTVMAVNPDAVELCNDLDDNCNSIVDQDAIDRDYSYADADSDGYGDPATEILLCEIPTGNVTNAEDCNDTQTTINPAATEVCDAANVDEDCDGTVDDADTNTYESTKTTWYADTDADNYGDPNTTSLTCEQPTSYVSDSSDCDDADPLLNPETEWYEDFDGDGYGNPESVAYSCTQPEGFVANTEDCNDEDATLNPNTVWYADTDADGYGNPTDTTLSCEQPISYVSDSSDCDDAAIAVNPDVSELCNSIDDNCDGIVDQDAIDRNYSYADADSDGYGDPATEILLCEIPTGNVTNAEDCNDTNAFVHPGALETNWDGSFNNCDASPYPDYEGPYNIEDLASTQLDGDETDQHIAPNPFTLVNAGDVNEDGYEDLLIGAPYTSAVTTQDDGVVYLVHGGINYSGSIGSNAYATLQHADASSYLHAYDSTGNVITRVDHLTASDSQDLVIGELSSHGDVFIWNSARIMAGTQDVEDADAIISDSTDFYYFAYSVSGGDSNGDGFADLLVGAPGGSKGYLFLGTLGGTFTSSDADLVFTATTDELGGASNAELDFDSDGYNDLVLGDSERGGAFVVPGDTSRLLSPGTYDIETVATLTLEWEDTPAGFSARSITTLPDVNGDGNAELILANTSYENTGFTNLGATALFLSSSIGGISGNLSITTSADLLLTGGNDADNLGYFAAGCQAVDRDSQGDLLVGAPYFDYDSEGVLFVLYGASLFSLSSTVLGNTNQNGMVRFLTTVPNNLMGLGAAATCIDWDADGDDDLAASIPYADSSSGINSAGAVYIVPNNHP